MAQRTTKKQTTRSRGRPKIEFDENQLKMLRVLAMLQCTDEEIASSLEISVKTLERLNKRDSNIVDIIKKGREEGRKSLRRMQYAAAEKGNITMLIWLGKQWLGQTDKQDLQHSGAIVLRFDREDKQL